MAISYRNLFDNKIQKTDIITATSSWTAPADVTSVELIMCGGGSGSNGGYASIFSDGGCGSVAYTVLNVTPGSSYTITIGAGGTGGITNGGTGGTGGTSSFGGLFSITGGTSSSAAGLGGEGGIGSNLYSTTSSGTLSAGGSFAGNGQPGAFGYGGGGGGAATSDFQGTYTLRIRGNATNGGASTGNGMANTGGGAAAKGASSGVGNAGGSGIAVIKYWSAL